MGAGTGPLATAANTYPVTLTFSGGGIADTDPIFTHFVNSLDWLIKGLERIGASGTFTLNRGGGNTVTSLNFVVTGPLLSPNTEKFNQAFNRLMWSMGHRRSSNPPPLGTPPPQSHPSGRAVTPNPAGYTPDELT